MSKNISFLEIVVNIRLRDSFGLHHILWNRKSFIKTFTQIILRENTMETDR